MRIVVWNCNMALHKKLDAPARIAPALSAAVASPGQSYMSGDGKSWTDVDSYYSGTNVCLKAFTSGAGAPPSQRK